MKTHKNIRYFSNITASRGGKFSFCTLVSFCVSGGGGAEVPASNPWRTMGAWRGQPEAKPSAAERVQSLCQPLWNVEADWWTPADSYRPRRGGLQSSTRERPSLSVFKSSDHVTQKMIESEKVKMFWQTSFFFCRLFCFLSCKGVCLYFQRSVCVRRVHPGQVVCPSDHSHSHLGTI